MEIIVNLAPPPESGTTQKMSVSAPPPKPNGTVKNVSVLPANSDPTVLNAPPQDTGITKSTNVSVLHPSSGTEKTVSALLHGSFIKEDVPTVPKDSNGSKTDVRNVTVHTKIWTFLKQNSDQFIHLSEH